MRTPPRRTLLTAFTLTAAYLVFVAPAAPAEDVVILKDGYTIRGKLTREIGDFDSKKYEIKAYLDAVGYGPKYVFFSTHAKKQLAAMEKGLPSVEPAAYRRGPFGTDGRKLPPVGELQAPDWKDDWSRTMKVKLAGGNFEIIEQRITYLGPDSMYVFSTTHRWVQAYDIREFPPEHIIKLLRTHPDLKDPTGSVDPLRRLKIAAFLKDAGWFVLARQEMAKLKQDAKGTWAKEATDRYDQLAAAIDTAEGKKLLEELELAVGSGRYETATRLLRQFEPKSADARDLTRLAELRATVEVLGPQHDTIKRLLRDTIDRGSGAAVANARGAALGGLAIPMTPTPAAIGDTAVLLDAARAVLAELHPDTASRLDNFRGGAVQVETELAAGKEPSIKVPQLLAMAVNGWLRGKNGGIPDPILAVKTWNTRVAALKYLRERIGNERAGILNDYLKSTNKLSPLEMAQIVSLLPPVDPEPLDKMSGKLLDTKTTLGYDRVYSRNTGPMPGEAGGYDYLIRLPDEYHHGRSYPLTVALADPGMPPEKVVANLAEMANRYGHVVIAPKWTAGFVGQFDYTGRDHPLILGCMRDVSRRFNIDPDRVFLFGVGAGGTLGLDLGLGHPDLFAGITLFGPMPEYRFYQHLWTNAQKLPIFTVTGDMSGASREAMRRLAEDWMPNGYQALFTVYKGRGAEWFSSEVGNAFDYMSRKTRARGVASLRLNDKRFDSWKSFRPGDNRFYWVGFEEIHPGKLFKTPDRPFLAPEPARFHADILRGNRIVVRDVVGVRKLAIWLERDMIDWEQDVVFDVEGAPAVPKKAKMVPDLRLMFEELYRTGDKKMLFFGKVEIKHPG